MEEQTEEINNRIGKILNEEIDSNMLTEFKVFANGMVSPVKLKESKCRSDIFDHLVGAGHIKGQEYGVLIKILNDAQLIKIKDKVFKVIVEVRRLDDKVDEVPNVPPVASSLPRSQVPNNSTEQSDKHLLFKIIQNSSAWKNWRMLGRELRVPNADLEAIGSDFKDNLKEQCYQVLENWFRAQPRDRATPNVLIEALKSIDNINVAEEMAEHLVQKPFN